MKTTVELKQDCRGCVDDDMNAQFLQRSFGGTRPAIIIIDGVEFEAHPRDGQNDIHINEIARRFCEEYNKP